MNISFIVSRIYTSGSLGRGPAAGPALDVRQAGGQRAAQRLAHVGAARAEHVRGVALHVHQRVVARQVHDAARAAARRARAARPRPCAFAVHTRDHYH